MLSGPLLDMPLLKVCAASNISHRADIPSIAHGAHAPATDKNERYLASRNGPRRGLPLRFFGGAPRLIIWG